MKKKLIIVQTNKIWKKIIFIIILITNLLIFSLFVEIQKRTNKTLYFSCFVTMVKLENKYLRELIEYYKKLKMDKFYIGDDNSFNSEKVSDILKDYIEEGYVEILDIREKNFTQGAFFKYTFDIYKRKCEWLAYFDVDEYLEFTDKKLTINKYLSQGKFRKCEVIKFNWLMYYDNDLIYYDNRTLQERFKKPKFFENDMRTIKCIVRGKIKRNAWINNSGPHETPPGLKECDSLGNFSPYGGGILYPPNYNYAYLKHYSVKSTEEFGYKIIKGLYNGEKFDLENRVDYYFAYNNFTYEKLSLLEKIFNRTFLKFHK